MVVEAGAGNGRLAREVLRAEPACVRALRYVLVERSAALRAAQREILEITPPDEAIGPYVRTEDEPAPVSCAGPLFTALDDFPARPFEGVVVANELLDNLPFGVAEWSGNAWQEIRVGLAEDVADAPTGPASGAPRPRFVEVAVPAAHEVAAALGTLTAGLDLRAGARLPVPRGLDEWIAESGTALGRGFVLLIDYVVDLERLLGRGPEGWLRTYRDHSHGGSPLEEPGSQDITADVVAEQLGHAARASGLRVVEDLSQAEWLRGLGIDDLVEEGRRVWEERAHLGDLAAIAGRSRVHEAAALTDPEGLGGHRVVVLRR
ncbi:MAG: SAM-dependent methyltransferase [Acidimicrobiia bacterium]|nr:SAM-dependent methyltransferase [Acidimicrobiia bacterium]